MAAKTSMWVTIIVSVLITVATGLGAWNLTKTASIPETYATKVEVNEKIAEVKKDAEHQRDQIRGDLKEGFNNVQTEQLYIRTVVDEINRHLRQMNGD